MTASTSKDVGPAGPGPRDHHEEVRVAYLGGFSFLAFEGALWLVSAALGSFVSVGSAIVALVVGGVFILLGAQLIQRLMRRPSVGSENPLMGLSTSAAFVVPLCYPVIAAATLADTDWFFPAFAVVVGAHYPPFAYVYRMRLYLALCGVLVGGGTLIGWLFRDGPFSLAGYFAGAVLLAFGTLFFALVRREERSVG